MKHGQLHHLEYYVNDLTASFEFWNWFLGLMSYQKSKEWDEGISWAHPNGTYIVFVQTGTQYLSFQNSRQAAGLNHIAFAWESAPQFHELSRKLEDKGARILCKEDEYLCFEDINRFAVEVYLVT